MKTRAQIVRDLWLRHVCPERMTIHVKATGETIVVVGGVIQPPDNAAETSVTGSRLRQNAILADDGTANSGDRRCKSHRARVLQPVTDNRVCEWCRGKFFSARNDAKYCSPRCRMAAQRDQAKQRRKKEADELLARAFKPMQGTARDDSGESLPATVG